MYKKRELDEKIRMITLIGVTYNKIMPVLPKACKSSKALVKPYIHHSSSASRLATSRADSKYTSHQSHMGTRNLPSQLFSIVIIRY